MTKGFSNKQDFFNIRQDLLVSLFLVVATLAVYGKVSHHSYVIYDDSYYITENPRVQAGLTAEGVVWAFTSTHALNWHPMTWLSHMLDVQLYGVNPAAHHLTNLLFHIFN